MEPIAPIDDYDESLLPDAKSRISDLLKRAFKYIKNMLDNEYRKVEKKKAAMAILRHHLNTTDSTTPIHESISRCRDRVNAVVRHGKFHIDHGSSETHILRSTLKLWSNIVYGDFQSNSILVLSEFPDYAKAVAGQAVLFYTSHGFLGIAPRSVAVEDQLVFVKDSSYGLILRRCGEHYIFRGMCIIHPFWKNPFGQLEDLELQKEQYIIQ